MTNQPSNAIQTLLEIARDPDQYIARWKQQNGRKVIGLFPMNFPSELVAASGALPVVVQDKQEPITLGNNLLTEFYCGYTRGIADQAAKGQLALYDAFISADHCIQLIGAIDVVRDENEKPVFFEHLIAAMDDVTTHPQVDGKIASFIEEIERITGSTITDEALSLCIAAFNENRQLLRGIFDARRAGDARFTTATPAAAPASSGTRSPTACSAGSCRPSTSPCRSCSATSRATATCKARNGKKPATTSRCSCAS